MKPEIVIKFKSESAVKTVNQGKLFSKLLKPKDVVLLVGALGGGKTTFTQGILKGLGYHRRVLSPSFTIIRQYQLKKLTVRHVDLYRLKSKPTEELGLVEFIYQPENLVLIEWGDKLAQKLERYLRVEFSYLGQSQREIAISAFGYQPKQLKYLKKVYQDEFISN